jgi:hypothetical protein
MRGSKGDLAMPSVAMSLMPTPTTRDTKGANQRGDETCLAGALLPTVTAGDAKASGSRNLPGSNANPGVSLTDALIYGGSTTPRSGAGKPSLGAQHHTPGLWDLEEESNSPDDSLNG